MTLHNSFEFHKYKINNHKFRYRYYKSEGGVYMFESLKENWFTFSVSTLSPLVIISGILLLLANKHERKLLTPRKTLYRKIIKILILSSLGATLASGCILLIASILNRDDIIFKISDLVLYFVIYLVVMPITINWAEKKEIIYHWIYLEKYQYTPLLIYKVTFNNRLLLSSIASPDDKLDKGFIIIEDISILDNEKIHFIGSKKKNIFSVYRPKIEDLIAAIEKNSPKTNRDEDQ